MGMWAIFLLHVCSSVGSLLTVLLLRLNTINEGRVAIGDMSGFVPCTPNGCIELIKRSGVSMTGARAVVVGRSKIVGTPAAELLKWHNATVTVIHSRSKDIEKLVIFFWFFGLICTLFYNTILFFIIFVCFWLYP